MNVQTCMTVIKCFFVFKQKTAYEMRISDWSSDVCSSDLIVEEEGHLELVALDRLRAVGGRLAVVAEELDAIGPLRHLHREMDVTALGPAIDLPAAGEHAVVAEVERRILDDDALVPIILDRVREIDQDMARPLPEMIAVQPAAFGDREFGEHAGLETDAIID